VIPIVFPLPRIQDVEVTYGNKAAKLTVGVTLDVFGGLALAGGTAAFVGGLVAEANNHSDVSGGIFVALFIGVPLLVVGNGFLIPGIFLTRSGAQRPKYPLGQASRVTAGPGGVCVSF
jgi:hypothetical protein